MREGTIHPCLNCALSCLHPLSAYALASTKRLSPSNISLPGTMPRPCHTRRPPPAETGSCGGVAAVPGASAALATPLRTVEGLCRQQRPRKRAHKPRRKQLVMPAARQRRAQRVCHQRADALSLTDCASRRSSFRSRERARRIGESGRRCGVREARGGDRAASGGLSLDDFSRGARCVLGTSTVSIAPPPGSFLPRLRT